MDTPGVDRDTDVAPPSEPVAVHPFGSSPSQDAPTSPNTHSAAASVPLTTMAPTMSRTTAAPSEHGRSPVSPTIRLSRRRTMSVSSDGAPTRLRRRPTYLKTFRAVADYDEVNANLQPGWEPGSEPGYDPSKPDGGHASMPALSAACTITIIDISTEDILVRQFSNAEFIEFIQKPQEDWVQCRWISVNGLSWDVIQAIGKAKGLHRLALEDIIELKNRTKADWYSNHAFIVLTLQKLVQLVDDSSGESDSDSDSSDGEGDDDDSSYSHSGTRRNQPEADTISNATGRFNFHKITAHLKRQQRAHLRQDIEMPTHNPSGRMLPLAAPLESYPIQSTSLPFIRTLQRYHASDNEARTDFMEVHSSLADRKLAVSAEQVALFLTNDNTIISFFEISAADVERPILRRLRTTGTVLRQSCDASLLVQAVIDAIIDLAIPLTNVYSDVIGDLELDVLTNPNIKQSRRLYIIISEITKMLSFLNPIDNIVNVLREHNVDSFGRIDPATTLRNPETGVIVTPVTHVYLGDVLDHCVMITEALGQIKASADNLIQLIFNMTSATQNETMKQLTTITIIFLPLTFITGFFGQNFAHFPEIEHDIVYFWKCAVPTVFATILLIMYRPIRDALTSWRQKIHIEWTRKSQKERKKKRIRARRIIARNPA